MSMMTIDIICAILWGITGTLHFIEDNYTIGVLCFILVLLNGIKAGMRK